MPESSEQDVPSKLAEYNTDMYGKHKAFRGNWDDENDRTGILEKGHLRRCHTDYLALPESRLQMLRCFFSLVDYSPPAFKPRNSDMLRVHSAKVVSWFVLYLIDQVKDKYYDVIDMRRDCQWNLFSHLKIYVIIAAKHPIQNQ